MSVEHPQQRPQYMTPAEVATLFRVDPSTVRRWARLGKLHPTTTVGGHSRYLASEIDALLAGEVTQNEENEQNEEEN